MTRYYFALCFAWVFCCLATAQATDVRELKAKIDNLMADTAYSDGFHGVMIYDLDAGCEVYARNADKLFRPASILKLLTAITAADDIGAETPCFKTRVGVSGTIAGGVLEGDLYVKGGFDPEFSDADMDELVAAVRAAGISKVAGRIYGDISMTDSLYWGSGWCWDDAPSAFQPYMSPLMFEKGRVRVSVPPRSSGKKPSVFPKSSYYRVCDLRSTPPFDRMDPGATRDYLTNGNDIIIKGNVNYAYTRELSVFRSQDFFMRTFVDRLCAAGVSVSADYGFARMPAGARSIATVSRPLLEALHEMLKESDNLSADAVLFQLGARLGIPSYGRKECVGIINEKIRELGLNPSAYRLVDGCGISLYNHVSPRLMLRFLVYAYGKPALRRMLMACLPTCGVDGTLKNRMRGTLAVRRVVAKTGTVSNVGSLAGYVRSLSGRNFAFVVISNNILSVRRARGLQDGICAVLCQE